MRKLFSLFLAAGSLMIAGLACAQTPEFDAASIKSVSAQDSDGRFMIGGLRGGPGTADPGRLTGTHVPMMALITRAWGMKDIQIVGPSWLSPSPMDSVFFDIAAKIPAGATKEQVQVMLQNLLIERFHLKAHHDSKETQGYELTVAKGGPKMKPSSAADSALAETPLPEDLPKPPPLDAQGRPQLDRPGLIMMMRMSPKGPSAHMVAKAVLLSELIDVMTREMKKPVIDKTNLTGRYDFNLDYTPDMSGMPPPPPGGADMGRGPMGAGPNSGMASDPDSSGLTLAGAIQSELGLKLDAKKVPLDLLVIESIDKTPTEN